MSGGERKEVLLDIFQAVVERFATKSVKCLGKMLQPESHQTSLVLKSLIFILEKVVSPSSSSGRSPLIL